MISEKDIEYQLLKEVNSDKIHISFSEYSKFKSCGHRHLIEKYLKLAIEPQTIHLIFGNSIHKAIELGIKENADVEKRVMIFREDFYKQMHDNLHDTPEINDLNDFMSQGENIVRYLSTEKIIKKYKIIGVEYALYEHIYGQFYYKGFIDLIVQDRETEEYVIIDWKTSGEKWDVHKKKRDEVFMAQMRLYKFFFARKNNIPLEKIQCKYVVLNRLKSKKDPKGGFGSLQPVEIFSSREEIKESIKSVAEVLRQIHIENSFPKAKLLDRKDSCYFCPFKTNAQLCNNSGEQAVTMLKESRMAKPLA